MPSVHKTVSNAGADVFTAIAHPVRRQILDLLAAGDKTVTILTESFDISQSAISQHLSILLEIGLVSREKRGREQIYHLQPAYLAEIHGWIRQYEHFWPQKLDALGAYLDKLAEDEEQS